MELVHPDNQPPNHDIQHPRQPINPTIPATQIAQQLVRLPGPLVLWPTDAHGADPWSFDVCSPRPGSPRNFGGAKESHERVNVRLKPNSDARQPCWLISIVFFSASISALLVGGSSTSGRVCIAPLDVERARQLDHDYPDGRAPREFRYEFSVQFDTAAPIDVPADEAVLVTFDTGRRYQVQIRDAGRIIESFYFTFEERGLELCLSYSPWYQTWQLDPPRSWIKACDCSDAEPLEGPHIENQETDA